MNIYDEISKIPVLAKEEERQLFEQYNAGDESAKQKLVEHNLKLVLKIAWKMKGMSVDDMFQEGVLGLTRAVELFDITKGYRFSSYATMAIKSYIMRAIDNNRTIVKVPVMAHYQHRKGEDVDIPEIYSFDYASEDVNDFYSLIEDKNATEEMEGVLNKVQNEELGKRLDLLLTNCNPNTAKILKERAKGATNTAIAKEKGRTRQCISNCCKCGLQTLRKYAEQDQILLSFLEV